MLKYVGDWDFALGLEFKKSANLVSIHQKKIFKSLEKFVIVSRALKLPSLNTLLHTIYADSDGGGLTRPATHH